MDTFYIICGIFLACVVVSFFSVCFRLAVTHPVSLSYYTVKDFVHWLLHKGWHVCPTGKLKIYCGLFGKGKTLSLVHEIVALYNKYNGKMVWNKEMHKFVPQIVKVLSNVELLIPYEKLVSLEQLVICAEKNHEMDLLNGTYTVTIACIDELSVQLNSREFKKNINASFLNTLLCCRHYHMSILGSSQRFNHCDALLRQVTQTVVQCNKIWRFQVQEYYDAYMLENSTNPMEVKPLRRKGFFVKDKDYNNYDTLAVVGRLKKSWKDGDMLSDQEILELQSNGTNVTIGEEKKNFLGLKRKKNRV